FAVPVRRRSAARVLVCAGDWDPDRNLLLHRDRCPHAGGLPGLARRPAGPSAAGRDRCRPSGEGESQGLEAVGRGWPPTTGQRPTTGDGGNWGGPGSKYGLAVSKGRLETTRR